MTRVLIPRETAPGETRVAATPETVGKLVDAGLEVVVERSAGERAHFLDPAYEKAGAHLVDPSPSPVGEVDWGAADMVLVVAPPEPARVRSMSPGSVLVGLLAPYGNAELVSALNSARVTSLAMELVPRISRAQSMDALSSQASIAGYKAVVLAAAHLGKYFPLLMTAAGTISPARVVVMGAGVAGLQAIATAKRLGAVVEVSDIRPEVEEQVQSLGGRFIELPLEESGSGEGGYAKAMGEEFLRRQREIVTRHVEKADVVVTTALVPGRPAPRLVTREMVEAMKPGAVVVDIAVAQGGNCELSRADEVVTAGAGVTILAPSNLPATMPLDASILYARNVHALIAPLLPSLSEEDREAPGLALPEGDEVIDGSLLTRDGDLVNERVASTLQEVTE